MSSATTDKSNILSVVYRNSFSLYKIVKVEIILNKYKYTLSETLGEKKKFETRTTSIRLYTPGNTTLVPLVPVDFIYLFL